MDRYPLAWVFSHGPAPVTRVCVWDNVLAEMLLQLEAEVRLLSPICSNQS